MVIVRLVGGVGNQLFQYAAARSLAVRHRVNLKLDITPFDAYKLHKYSLSNFNIQEELATCEEIERIKSGVGINKWLSFMWYFRVNRTAYYRQPVFTENVLGPFDPNIFKTPKNIYLDGYWQSEKYFFDIQDIIRTEFTTKPNHSLQTQQIAEHITNVQSVSIHIRRGDYVSNPETNRVHGACNLDYYHRCIAKIRENIVSPHFFVFSDDPKWVINNLRIAAPITYVTHNDASRNYEDLHLMSLCRHNIIANSSFSWWGAWLNANPNKMILAPRKWFNDASIDTSDLLPDKWLKI